MKNKITLKQVSEFIIGAIAITVLIVCMKLTGIEIFPESSINNSINNSIISDKEKTEETLKSVKHLSDSMENLDKEINEMIKNTKYNAQLPLLYAALINATSAYNQECLNVESSKNRNLSNKELDEKLSSALDIISLGLCSKASAYENYAEYIDSGSIKSSSQAMTDIVNADKMIVGGTAQIIVIAKEQDIEVE
ncbi:MAG: hypothetical protein V1825_00235 [Candidatus Falkowbacteria bacterium]